MIKNPAYHSSLSIANLFRDGVILPRGGKTYTSLFFHLKSQRTFLQKTFELIEKKATEVTDQANSYILNQAASSLKKLLNSKYGELIENSYESVEVARKLLGQTKCKDVIDLLLKMFTNTISISKSLVMFCSKDEPDNDWAHKIDDNERDDYLVDSSPLAHQEKTMICRICNEHVPCSLIEQHTVSCLEAFNYESKIAEIDQRIEALSRKIATMNLAIPWPGKQKEATTMYLPILHLEMLLGRASQIESRSTDSVSELDLIGSSIYWMDVSINKTEAKKLLLEKIDICSKIDAAREVLSKTRVSGSDKTGSLQPTVADFKLIKRISSGAYARVFLAKKKLTGDTFAIKVLPKKSLQQKNQLKRILIEKDILLQFYNPYITNFYYSITGKQNLYLVMEFIPGGDLFSLLQKFGCFDEISAKIYTYQIASALKYLFQNGIIHRDLKPDNILITKDGYLKLADFGLSYIGAKKRTFDNDDIVVSGQSSESLIQAKSIVGTPDYISPEMVLGIPHSFTTDYWSLGIIVYEMLTGMMPFHEDTEKETCKRVVKGIFEPLEGFSKEAVDFVDRLLVTDPKKRLGCHGPDEILDHPWLRGMSDGTIIPPWVPELTSETSTENFEERYKVEESVFEIPADIEEDILSGLAQKRRASDIPEFHPHTRKNSDSSIEADSQASEDELSLFPSIHIAQLVKQNQDEAQKMSLCNEVPVRPMSYSGVPEIFPPKLAEADPVQHSPTYMGLAPSSSFGGRRRSLRRNSFIGVNAADDSVLKQLRTGRH